MTDCDHEWVVYSTALEDKCLLLQCVECGLAGTVDKPTRKEWKKAFHAPSKPYRWKDTKRIHVRKHARLHVVRAEYGPRCECLERGVIKVPGAYERFPAEIELPKKPLTVEEREELLHLADVVCKARLCSRLFPFFLDCCQQDTGREATGAVKRVASRLEGLDTKGLHCSPSIVARVLREWATHGMEVSGDEGQHLDRER